jgi:hypothetical protein
MNSTAYRPRHSLRQSDIADEELLLNDLVNNKIVQQIVKREIIRVEPFDSNFE